MITWTKIKMITIIIMMMMSCTVLAKKPYAEGEIMMECSKCQDWFHFECIGYIGT